MYVCLRVHAPLFIGNALPDMFYVNEVVVYVYQLSVQLYFSKFNVFLSAEEPFRLDLCSLTVFEIECVL